MSVVPGYVSDYMYQYLNVPPQLGTIEGIDATFPAGYNIYTFPTPIFCPRGTMVMVTNFGGIIGMVNYPQNGYSEKNWRNQDYTDRSSMYLRILTTGFQPRADRNIYFMKTYQSPGMYSVVGSFVCGTNTYTDTQTFEMIGKIAQLLLKDHLFFSNICVFVSIGEVNTTTTEIYNTTESFNSTMFESSTTPLSSETSTEAMTSSTPVAITTVMTSTETSTVVAPTAMSNSQTSESTTSYIPSETTTIAATVTTPAVSSPSNAPTQSTVPASSTDMTSQTTMAAVTSTAAVQTSSTTTVIASVTTISDTTTTALSTTSIASITTASTDTTTSISQTTTTTKCEYSS